MKKNEKIRQAREEFNKIIGFVSEEALCKEIDAVEGEIFRMLLRLGRILLELFGVLRELVFLRSYAALFTSY